MRGWLVAGVVCGAALLSGCAGGGGEKGTMGAVVGGRGELVMPTEASGGWESRARGVRVRDWRVGGGGVVGAGERVALRFELRLADGTVYDSTAARRRALVMALDDPGLVEGARIGLAGMRVGGVREVRIPWAVGYGRAGRAPIPPETDLVWFVEVVERAGV